MPIMGLLSDATVQSLMGRIYYPNQICVPCPARGFTHLLKQQKISTRLASLLSKSNAKIAGKTMITARKLNTITIANCGEKTNTDLDIPSCIRVLKFHT